MVTWSWLGVLTLFGGIATGAIAAVVWRRYDGPGTTAFVVTMTGASIVGFADGLNFFVLDVGVSRLLELPYWFGSEVMIVGYAFFALAFTGRGRYLTRRNAVILSAIPAVTVLVAATNASHGWFWERYTVVTTLGAAVGTFDPEPWLYVKSTYAVVLVGASYLLFVEEIYVEKTLYRNQSVALVLGSVLPLFGYVVWLLDLGPYPDVDLFPPLLPVTALLFGYAVFAADLFETTPAARRIGRRTAIDTLTQAVVVLDAQGRITDLNGAAVELFGTRRIDTLGKDVNDVLEEAAIDPDRVADPQSLSLVVDGERREFEVSSNRVTDRGDTTIGYTVLFYDVTRERRREQRLEVLNRVLRHNLRNDLNAATGYIDLIRETTDEERIEEWASRAEDRCEDLVDLGEKAREFEEVLDPDQTASRRRIALTGVLEDVVESQQTEYPSATIRRDLADDVVVEVNPAMVRLVLSNVLENALEHHDGAEPLVEITGRRTGSDSHGDVVVEVTDDGPGIPEAELAPLREGEERPLQHGQGIGLWLVHWGMQTMGGSLAFETTDAGSTVTLRLPAASERAGDEAAVPAT